MTLICIVDEKIGVQISKIAAIIGLISHVITPYIYGVILSSFEMLWKSLLKLTGCSIQSSTWHPMGWRGRDGEDS